ncbi:OprD family outer membrane porin [Pareuzebyella sediminis]|uniref:OprD family outer membrane porin n=1 Tax=Pareuzebyella sediminis TaxID=2607998 RepID=UPI0011EE28D4|nr:OprD family outer membrane porin [Pareuzebyella sediminis]
MLRNLLLYAYFIVSSTLFSQGIEKKHKGKFSGQWRTYYMNTLNKGELKDFSALATGGKIAYTYKFHKKFELGSSLYNSTNLGWQDLTLPDRTTGKGSRYEEGLFDRLYPEKDAVFLLGELYATYTLPKHQFKIGRMKINTPLINPEDGRMIPTLVQGFWYTHKLYDLNRFQFGVLHQIAPRSTGEFFGIGESIGTYPVGRNELGQASLYSGNTRSDYIWILNTNFKLGPEVRVDLWNYYVNNVFNSLYFKPSWQLSPNVSLKGEWLHQNRVGHGGNAIDTLRYFTDATSDLFGFRMEYRWKASMVNLSYNRILPQGRFISPREWGREDLFSFQKRERSEGTSDNHAVVLNYHTIFEMPKKVASLKSLVSVGRHWKPSVLDAKANKYAMPDYTHLNVDLFFDFKKLPNLKPELLFTKKWAHGNFPDQPNFYFNKTDLFHMDIILNYNF